MRSVHSSRSTNRSSFSRRNGGISHKSHFSKTHSSLNHHTSMHRSKIGSMSRKSLFKHHGISDAHAFQVGKTTGININASAMGAHGAALHRFKTARKYTSGNKNTFKSRKSSFKKTVRLSHNKRRYTNNINNINLNHVGEEFEKAFDSAKKYLWVPILIMVFMLLFMGIMFITLISNVFRF